MQVVQPRKNKFRTLRDFGFLSCEHPEGSIAYDRGVQHCPMCGARRVGVESWEGGSIDYRIDTIVLQAFGKKLAENLQGEQLP